MGRWPWRLSPEGWAGAADARAASGVGATLRACPEPVLLFSRSSATSCLLLLLLPSTGSPVGIFIACWPGIGREGWRRSSRGRGRLDRTRLRLLIWFAAG